MHTMVQCNTVTYSTTQCSAEQCAVRCAVHSVRLTMCGVLCAVCSKMHISAVSSVQGTPGSGWCTVQYKVYSVT